MNIEHPKRILDLHTHLFNSHYLPLGSILADMMEKEHSVLAEVVARLIWRITESNHVGGHSLAGDPHAHHRSTEELVDSIWRVSADALATAGPLPLDLTIQHSPRVMDTVTRSDLMEIVQALEGIDYLAEGVPPEELPTLQDQPGIVAFDKGMFLGRVGAVIRRALRAISRLSRKLEHGEDVLEFILTMLKSEDGLVNKLFEGYGDGLPPIRVVHYLMDMELAYPQPANMSYRFLPQQLQRMQDLKSKNEGRIIGFSAFDPRRANWLDIARESVAKGFAGFKFYPALSYKPVGNDATIQGRIDGFFDYCIEHDYPIFAHCTPVGFETKEKLGLNAHPKFWAEVLAKRPSLRLCLGHAGGGEAERNDNNRRTKYHGWMARDEREWSSADNFARIVSELCKEYPNVYCEIAYMPEMIDDKARIDRFVDNLERARGQAGKFDFMTKIAYGSDWHMPSAVDKVRRYLDVYLEIFNRREYLDHLDDVFWNNGHSFMRLDPEIPVSKGVPGHF